MFGYYLNLYLLTIPVFFAIDLIWLGVAAMLMLLSVKFISTAIQ